MTQCIGYWKSQKTDDNFEDYLKEIGKQFAYTFHITQDWM